MWLQIAMGWAVCVWDPRGKIHKGKAKIQELECQRLPKVNPAGGLSISHSRTSKGPIEHRVLKQDEKRLALTKNF
jgi:hypothetical protein